VAKFHAQRFFDVTIPDHVLEDLKGLNLNLQELIEAICSQEEIGLYDELYAFKEKSGKVYWTNFNYAAQDDEQIYGPVDYTVAGTSILYTEANGKGAETT
jgi:hypothetical protein